MLFYIAVLEDNFFCKNIKQNAELMHNVQIQPKEQKI